MKIAHSKLRDYDSRKYAMLKQISPLPEGVDASVYWDWPGHEDEIQLRFFGLSLQEAKLLLMVFDSLKDAKGKVN